MAAFAPYKKLTHNPNHSVVLAPNKEAGVVICGNNELFSDGYYSVHDKEGEITVFFDLESLGELSSRVFPTIKCYTRPDGHPDSEITSTMAGAGVMGNPLVLYAVESGTTFLMTNLECPHFKELSGSVPNYLWGIAIFCNGDTTKDFDHFISFKPNEPVFDIKEELVESHDYEYIRYCLILEEKYAAPKDILSLMVPGKTVFRLQKSGGGHVYPMNNFFVPKQLTSYAYKISVKPDWRSGETGQYLRMGTRFIRIGFLTNYGQTSSQAKLMIKNFHVAQID